MPERKKEGTTEEKLKNKTNKTNKKEVRNDKSKQRSNKSMDRTKQDSQNLQDSRIRSDRDISVPSNLHHDASKPPTSGGDSGK